MGFSQLRTFYLIAFLVQSTQQQHLYRIQYSYNDDQTRSDYGNATNGVLVDAAITKSVTLGAGTQCSAAGTIYIPPAGTIVEGGITSMSLTSGVGILAGCEQAICNSNTQFVNPSTLTAVTPADSRNILENSENVAVSSLTSFSYVLTITADR